MKTIQEVNFREVPEPETCLNCDNSKCYLKSEGYNECQLTGHVMVWGTLSKYVCDEWKKKPPVNTVRKKALAKLTAEEKKELGL